MCSGLCGLSPVSCDALALQVSNPLAAEEPSAKAAVAVQESLYLEVSCCPTREFSRVIECPEVPHLRMSAFARVFRRARTTTWMTSTTSRTTESKGQMVIVDCRLIVDWSIMRMDYSGNRTATLSRVDCGGF